MSAKIVILFLSVLLKTQVGLTAPSIPLRITTPSCASAVASSSTIFGPVTMNRGANKLYKETALTQWELDDYGPIFRHSTLSMSESEKFRIEQFRPALDMGPSRPWIQTLQNLGQMPRDLSLIATTPGKMSWNDIDRFLEHSNSWEYEHPMRTAHLTQNRNQYVQALWHGFQFVMGEYPRRPWFTKEFRAAALDGFKKTIRNASYLFVRDKVTNEVLAAMRLVYVHNGLLRLRHQASGRTLEIMGNAELTWGTDGNFTTSKNDLIETYQVDQFLPEFFGSNEALVKKLSGFESIDLIKLPMEQGLKIDLPRNYQFMDLRGHKGFESGTTIEIAGEVFAVEFGHAVVVEPGLFAIKKSPNRGEVFAELALWLGHALSKPALPQWVNERDIGYWTYNDLPLYTIFGFEKDSAFTPVHKYNVTWDVYGSTADKIFPALRKLTSKRSDDSERTDEIMSFMNSMDDRGL